MYFRPSPPFIQLAVTTYCKCNVLLSNLPKHKNCKLAEGKRASVDLFMACLLLSRRLFLLTEVAECLVDLPADDRIF